MDEKLVEKVAEVLARRHSKEALYAYRAAADSGYWNASARAVIPIVLEEAAKVADSAVNKLNGPEKSGMARSIAARIRGELYT